MCDGMPDEAEVTTWRELSGFQLAQPLLIQTLTDVLNSSTAPEGFRLSWLVDWLTGGAGCFLKSGAGWLLASLISASALASSVLISEYFRHGFVLAVLSRTVHGAEIVP